MRARTARDQALAALERERLIRREHELGRTGTMELEAVADASTGERVVAGRAQLGHQRFGPLVPERVDLVTRYRLRVRHPTRVAAG